MATERKARGKAQSGTQTHIHVGGAPVTEPNDKPLTPDEEAVEEALSQLPENTVAKIYRIRDDGQREFVTQTTPQAATEERCAKTGKPGKYVILFWGPLNNGTNKNGYRGQRTVYVGEDLAASVPVQAVPAPASGSRFDDMMAAGFMNLLNATAAQSREHSAAMTALLSKLAAPPERDPVITALLTSVLGGSRADPIEQATKIAELSTKGTGKSGASEILATLDLVDRIRGDGNGGGGDKPRGWIEELASTLAPAVVDIIKEKAKGPAIAESNLPNVPERRLRLEPPANTPPRQPETSAVSQQPAAVVADYLQPIVPLLGNFVWVAERKFTPTIAAAMLLEQIPDTQLDMMAEILAQPSLVPDIIAAEPRLRSYQSWLDEVRTNAIEQLEPDEEDEPEEETGTT